VLAELSSPVADAWVATAAGDRPYLVPLTLAWFQDRIVLATARSSPTGRNLLASGRARLALGATRDVVMVEATLEDVVEVAGPQSEQLGAAYVAQNDWDPRQAGPDYVFLLLRPVTIQAWREVDELAGRTVMRDGSWLE
jgi:hypothetical protein